MIEIDAAHFFDTVEEVRRLTTIAEQELDGGEKAVDQAVRERISGTIALMAEQLAVLGAQSAWVAANRFVGQLDNPDHRFSYRELKSPLQDIESRFSDHLGFIKLFVVRGEQMPLLGTAAELLGEQTAARFRGAWFDSEEAAKCILVQRPTAAVFHSMRMLEIGIKSLAKRLGIENPVKPSQRNWGVILSQVRAKIDADYPAGERLGGSEGAFFDKLYATLDAVKNPWRNETMHVEGVYQDGEARHILLNTIAFLQLMATRFDEDGNDIAPVLIA